MLDSRYVRFVVETGKSSTIAASKLAGLDRFTIAADDGALDSTAYVVVRDGDDLVMLFADGTRVVIEDYFTSTASFAFDGLGQAVELPLDAQPIGTVGDKALYAFSGDVDGARTILLENRGFTALEPLLDDAAIAALPAGVGLPLMLPLALGLVAAAGGSTAAAVIQTTIKGLFLAGPIIDGNGLSVDIFDNKGNLLARDVPLNEDGSFSVTLEGTYTSVIAILRDGNEADDYRDEATGLPRDLTAQLMSVGTGQPQGDGNTLVNLNINPITTVAARNAGLGQDGTIPEGGLSDAQINDANKATADAFGLSDVNAVAPVNIFDPAFNDTDGDVSESEKYGQILAMMSGLDQKNNGDQQAAIEQIAATLRNAPDADTAQQQVKDNLTEGAVEFEFKNKGGTENEADLLSSPALGIQNTPDVDTEGTSQAPAVTALLDDLASQPDDGDDTPITAAQLQQAVDAANAVQQLVALGAEDAVPAALSETLSEENLELLGLTGLTPAPSPYLGEFLSVLKAAADDGSATDSVAELQALLDGVISAGLTPSQTIEPNADGTITVSGQTVPGASVTVAYPDGTSVTVVADENGAYSATSAAPQTSGNISVSAADSAGNTSAPVVEAYQDETPPVAPTAVLEVNGDGTLSVSGTGEPGSTVTTVFPDGSTGTALVADDGSYGPITSAAAQPSTNVAVTQQDAAGNLSPAAVDETAPFGPSVTEANAAGLSGTAEPGSIVTLFDGGEPPVAIASTTVGEDGSWAIPASDFPGGTTDGFAGSVTATDAAGNVSDPTDVPAIDGTAPAAPGVDAANGDGLSGTGTTDDVIALLDNNGDPVLDGEGNPVTAVVDGDGNWSIPASAFPGGTTEGFAGSVTATDAAGNVSDPTDVPAIDGTAPAAPGVDAANGDGLSGTGTTDDVIALLDNNGDPVLDGEGNPVTAVVDGDGNWSIPASAFPGGTTDGFAGSVTATDAAGNVSDPTDVPAIDGTAPAAPGVDAANGDGLSGTGTTDDVIALLDNNGDPVLDGEGNPVTAVVDGDGNWSIPASAFPGGTTEGFAGSVTATDAAGNVSDPTDVPAIDGTAPAAPGVDAANGDGLSGTGTTDDVIALLDNNGDPVLDGEGNPVTAVVDGDGNWSIPASAFPGGTTEGFAGSVTATDAAGNVSDPTTVPAIDGTAPTVTISDDTANTATGDVTFTFTFSEAVTGFSADNLTVTNGTKGTFTAVNSTVYRLVVTPTANSAGDITVATSTTGVTDAAGNTATAPADYVQAFDTAAPTATVDIAATDLNDGANTSDVTITFTEAVTEFDVNDLTITNGTIASVSSSNGGITWTGTFTATDDIEGTGSVELTGAYTDVAGNTGDTGANDTVAIDTRVLTPTINPGITDQANTVSGTGEAGAVVTVNMLEGGLSTLVGTATVWTDGTWSFVAASPIADGAELVATQQDKAGNRSFAAQVTSFTDTDGDGTRDTLDDDDDKDGISDTDEAQRESTVDVTAQTTAASGVNIGTPSTGYVTVDNGSGDQINFVSTTLGESGNDAGLGTQSSVTYDFNTVATEQVTDVTFSIRIDQFDDGLFIKINDTVIVDFNEGSYFIQANGSDLTGIGLNTKFDSGNLAPGETFQRPNVWAAFAGEGRPELVIDVALGTVALLVDLKAGGRENILDDIQDIIDNYDMRNENKVTNPLPGLDFESGVTITTGLNNGTGNALIASQVVTVTGTYAGADDIDGDGIANWLDIDTDNDRIWDKYELSTDTDDDGVADYRDTDSNGASAGTDTSRASLTAAEITALENGGTSSNVVAGVYSNEFNDSIILLSDDGLTLNFGNITDISAAFANAPVEYIDMEDGGNAQTVTLNASDLIALTDANNTLIIIGEAGDTGDTVNASGFEDTGKDISIENKVYDIYQQVGGDATLIIDDDITVNLT